MDTLTLYKGSDMLLDLEGLTNEATGEYLNAATVSVTLKDSTGTAVSGESWPKTMAYVSDTNGVYRCALTYALSITAGQRYTAEITAVQSGQRAFWTVDVLCKTRRR